MKVDKLFEETSSTSRIEVEYHGDWNQRVFFESFLKEEHKHWLEKGSKTPRGEATVDLNGDKAYLNRIDVYPKGRGFGSELLAEILKELTKRGFKTARTYIENANPDSRMMVKKFKFEEAEKSSHGSYWEKSL